MSLSSCLSPESDLSDINGFDEDLTLVLVLWELKTPAVEQLLENTFPTPDLGKENLTCFSPASVPDAAAAPCDDIPEKWLNYKAYVSNTEYARVAKLWMVLYFWCDKFESGKIESDKFTLL